MAALKTSQNEAGFHVANTLDVAERSDMIDKNYPAR